VDEDIQVVKEKYVMTHSLQRITLPTSIKITERVAGLLIAVMLELQIHQRVHLSRLVIGQ